MLDKVRPDAPVSTLLHDKDCGGLVALADVVVLALLLGFILGLCVSLDGCEVRFLIADLNFRSILRVLLLGILRPVGDDAVVEADSSVYTFCVGAAQLLAVLVLSFASDAMFAPWPKRNV